MLYVAINPFATVDMYVATQGTLCGGRRFAKLSLLFCLLFYFLRPQWQQSNN